MPQADTENRNLAQQTLDTADRVIQRCRIARAVGEKDTFRLLGQHILCGGPGRQDGYITSSRSQLLENRTFDAIVDDHDAVYALEKLYLVRLGAGYAAGQVQAGHGRRGFQSGSYIFLREIAPENTSAHGAHTADATGQRPGIDTGDTGDLLLGEPVDPALFGPAVSCEVVSLPDYNLSL